MKTALLRAALAGAGCTVTLGGAALVTSEAAHAGPPRPLCIYATVNGASGDVSALKCKNPDAGLSSSAVWSDGTTILESAQGDWISGRSGSRATSDGGWDDVWAFDPTMASYSDIKKELMRSWGYTTVSLETIGTGGDDPSYLVANYDQPSKKKH